MKIVPLLIFLFTASVGYSQKLPIDFEQTMFTRDFIDFAGGISTIIDNPQSGGLNSSSTVARMVRDGGESWAGSKLVLSDNLNFSSNGFISMKVFTNAPVGTIVKIKLEGLGETYRDMLTTVTNEWETLIWDFTGQPANFNSIVFMFDFGNVGDGSAASTFLFDDIEQVSRGTQIDWPVDFESTTVNYDISDFGGNYSLLVTDLADDGNRVMQTVKTGAAGTWAGTTIGSSSGFATNIPFTLAESKMTVKVWSPNIGTPIRLKVEDSIDPTHSCETEAETTIANQWEILEFDFSKESPGTTLLSDGLKKGWVYNKLSIFFNFGTDGIATGEQIYYFDDIKFEAKTKFEYKADLEKYEKQILQDQQIIKRNRDTFIGIIALLGIALGLYLWSIQKRSVAERKKLLDEIELLKKRLAAQSLAPSGNSKKLILNKEKIENAIDAKIGESSWMILNILFRSPSISNKEIAKEVSLSLEGVSSSLRRMYSVFDIKTKGNKKVALIMKTMRILFEE
jgi:hypothetical protein